MYLNYNEYSLATSMLHKAMTSNKTERLLDILNVIVASQITDLLNTGGFDGAKSEMDAHHKFVMSYLYKPEESTMAEVAKSAEAIGKQAHEQLEVTLRKAAKANAAADQKMKVYEEKKAKAAKKVSA